MLIQVIVSGNFICGQFKKDHFFNCPQVHYAFYVLSLVDGDFYTVVSVVFDNRNLAAYFVSLKNRDVHRIDFSRLDFSPAAPALMLDVHAPLAGNISGALKSNSREEAYAHYRKAVHHWGGKDVTDG